MNSVFGSLNQGRKTGAADWAAEVCWVAGAGLMSSSQAAYPVLLLGWRRNIPAVPPLILYFSDVPAAALQISIVYARIVSIKTSKGAIQVGFPFFLLRRKKSFKTSRFKLIRRKLNV